MKKIFAIIIVLLITASALSCGKTNSLENPSNSNTSDTTVQSNTESSASETISEAEKYKPELPDIDMEGYTYSIISRDNSLHPNAFHTRDLDADSINGDAINDAVYTRNSEIEERFNCVINMEIFPETISETTGNDVIKTAVLAGDTQYDLLTSHMIYAASYAKQGIFKNLNDMPYIDMTKPYWNQNATKNLSVGDKIFIGLSDLSFSTNENAYAIFFNKNLATDYSVEDPYQLVNDNNWTYDKFGEIIKTGNVDLNGDSVMDKTDAYGYISSCPANFLWAGGGHLTEKDENNYPYMDFMSEKTLSLFDKAYAITNNEFTYSGNEWHDKVALKMYQEGRGIFYSSQLIRVSDLREVEWDFGILPYPKYDSAQEEYYSYVDGHASMMCVPLVLENADYSGIILEALSYETYKNIIPLYYDVVLNTKLVRDENSAKMLDIIRQSKTFDFGYVYGDWETSFLFQNAIYQKKPDLSSAFSKRAKLATKTIEATVKIYESIDT